jgi:hypothetical protein
MQIAGVRQTGGAGANARQQVFNKDWMYLNLQSENGCPVTVTVTFKSESNANKMQNVPRGLAMDATVGSFEKTGMANSKAAAVSMKTGDPNAE